MLAAVMLLLATSTFGCCLCLLAPRLLGGLRRMLTGTPGATEDSHWAPRGVCSFWGFGFWGSGL